MKRTKSIPADSWVYSAKISRPRLAAVYQRERLFERLDATRARSGTWVTGPPGAGKTTLVASYLAVRQPSALWYQVDEDDQDPSTFFYFLRMAAANLLPSKSSFLPLLTPEYLTNISAFTRRFFRSLFQCLSRPTILVLDNYQEVPQETPFQEILRVALGEVPRKCSVIIISRQAPPGNLALLEANDTLSVIGWEELRLSDEEISSIISLRQQTKIQPASVRRLAIKAQRWAAGLVLLLEWLKRESIEPEALDVSVPETLFHYFTTEVLREFDPEAEQFVLQVSLLPRMTGSMARTLSGNPNAELILSDLVRCNNFVTRHVGRQIVYQFHPLFREFLLRRAPTVLGENVWHALKRRSAEVLEEEDDLESCVKSWKALEDWASMVRTISRLAPALLEQGRNQMLLQLLQNIPVSAEEDWPDLTYWRGMGLMHLDPSTALRAFEAAYTQAKKKHEVELLYSAWCGVVESYWFLRNEVHSLKHWLQELRQLQQYYGQSTSPVSEARIAISTYCAMALCSLDNPELIQLEKRVLQLIHGILPKPQYLMASALLMLRNAWFGGGHHAAKIAMDATQALLKSSQSTPLEHIMAFYCACLYHYCFTGAKEPCLEVTEAGLAKAAEHGINVLDPILIAARIYLHLTEEQLPQAQSFIMTLSKVWDPRRKYDLYLYHTILANERWLSGASNEALEHACIAYQAAIESGEQSSHAYAQAALAQIYASQGDHGSAIHHRALARHQAKQCGIRNVEITCWLSAAFRALERGQVMRCRIFLRRALAIGHETGYVRFPFMKRTALARLCAVALDAGIETDYVRRLARERELVPEKSVSVYSLEKWPWELRIKCFGDFEIVKNESVLVFRRKTPKKPLELLKALVAFGGVNVPESSLLDALWTDQEADAAKSSFNMALSRLRKLIGRETLVLQENRLSLDQKRCWVDVWAFESLAHQADAEGESRCREQKLDFLRKSLALYAGHFLAKEPELRWSIALRERLRRHYIQYVTELGGCLEQCKSWHECLNFYQRALEIDPFAEAFYQGLLRVYHELGRTAEAIDTYHRFARLLALTFGANPSPATKNLFRSMFSD